MVTNHRLNLPDPRLLSTLRKKFVLTLLGLNKIFLAFCTLLIGGLFFVFFLPTFVFYYASFAIEAFFSFHVHSCHVTVRCDRTVRQVLSYAAVMKTVWKTDHSV